MELPHAHPYGSTEGRKSTHDFLSLYSPVQQDSRSSQGGFFKTHDFLQPLELMTEEEKKVEAVVETSRLPATPLTTCSSIEHNILGGIGSYSMSHISYLNQRVPNSEGVLLNNQASSSDRNDDNSNGSSYTLWDESVVMNKGQTWKENNCAAKERHCVRGGNRQSFMKKQSFMDMIKSAKSGQENEDEDDVEFVIKKEPSPHHKGNMSIKMDEKGTDQKPNTPRSKHSATEQRRRSKINDRFQMLRGLIPHTDQKRDKASFLLEVIEYIQFLQEKVHKYEDPYERWSQEPPKMMPWQNGHRTNEAFGDQSGGTNCGSGSTLVFAAKIDEAITNVSSTMPQGGHGLLESEISTADTIREMDCQRGLTNNGLPLPSPLQQTTHKRSTSAAVQLPPRVTSNTEIRTSQPNPQLCQSRPCTTDSTNFSEKLKDQDLTIESGTISISTVYSQGLLNALTQSLHSSGVDLSQASISVQIDIGNRANSSIPIVQTDYLPSNNQTMLRSRLHSGGGESEQAFKRLKTASS